MFWNFGYLGESRESPISEFGIPRTAFGGILGNVKFNIPGRDLLTSMATRESFPETLKLHYTLVYHGDHLSWYKYLYFKKTEIWEIQALKCIIDEGLDWWFLGRRSRDDIFTTRF